MLMSNYDRNNNKWLKRRQQETKEWKEKERRINEINCRGIKNKNAVKWDENDAKTKRNLKRL